MPVTENEIYGPITIDRDNGEKRNLYNITRKEDYSYYYNENQFNNLQKKLSKKSIYLCELNNDIRPEIENGYQISCPVHYNIIINKVFYGRYANDTKHCSSNINSKYFKIKEKCGYEPIKYLKEICEGKVFCNVIPNNYFYKDYCKGIVKYLHVDYHCIKNPVCN